MRKLFYVFVLSLSMFLLPVISSAEAGISCEPIQLVQTHGSSEDKIQVCGSTIVKNPTDHDIELSMILAFYKSAGSGLEMTRCKVENVTVPSAARNWSLSIAADAEEGEIVKCFVMRPDTLAPVCGAAQAVVFEKNMAKFGFVYKFAVDEQTQQLGLRVFSDGGHKTMLVAPDAKIDGEQYASAVEAKAELDRLYPQEENMYWDDSEYGAFSMLFLTDETGQITYVDTPEIGYRESEYTLKPSWVYASFAMGTDTCEDGRLYGQFIDKDIDIIHVEGLMDSYDKYHVCSADKIRSGYDYQFLLMTTQSKEPTEQRVTYMMEKGYPVNNAPSIVHDRQMFVVSNVTRVLDEGGRETIKLYGMQEGAEKEIQIDSDYYRTSLYNDVWAFRDGGVFRAYYDPYSDTYSEGIVESEERKLCIFLPGDIIRYELYDRTGDVIRVTPTFLSDAKVFKADDMGRMGPSYTRYRAFDLAVVNRIEGDTAELTYLIDKKDGANMIATAVIRTNEAGYVVSSTSMVGQTNKFTNILYDEANKTYFFDTQTGMRTDLTYDLSKFKTMVYDVKKPYGQQVYAGTEADLYDTTDPDNPASLIIMQFRGRYQVTDGPRGMVILKL